MYKYIIFDFDDTLSDFERCKERSKALITPYLKKSGIDTGEYWSCYERLFEELFSRYINHELEVHEYRIMRFLHHGVTKEQAEKYNEIYLNTVNKALLFDDVIPVLFELKRNGFKIAVLTNGPLSQRKKIEGCEAGELFDEIFISAELGVGKPDLKVYESVCDKLKINKNEAIMIGDSYENDCVAAERAGIKSIQIKRDNKTITDYKNQIKSLYEIFDYLDTGEE